METIKQTKYLAFVDTDQPETKKTKIIAIVSIHHDEAIGEIRWFSRWRQYCFYPYKETVWNTDCLNDVNEVIRELMLKRKLELGTKKKNYKDVGVICVSLEDFKNWKIEQKYHLKQGANDRVFIYRNKRYICLTQKNNVLGFNFDKIIETTRAFVNPYYSEIVEALKTHLITKPVI